jgi:glycosyltransferase involved in cell wall biosynthesis
MNRNLPMNIWIWQTIVSPHMAGLATALVRHGCGVTYVAKQAMTADRALLGWSPPLLDNVRLEFASAPASIAKLVASARPDSIHICQGIRSNGLIRLAQRALARRHLPQWIVMETVDDAGWRGALKRLEYRRRFMQRRGQVQGVLAIGHSTPGWIVARGMPSNRVFPFAYFLPNPEPVRPESPDRVGRFRFLFVGHLVERKRLDFLIEALRRMPTRGFELVVVGTGPLEDELRALAAEALPGRSDWVGRLPLDAVPSEMTNADCLVLPSRHDGWGAVVSEALMAGTPVVCSNACGSAGVVRASGYGSVFGSGDVAAMVSSLTQTMSKGHLSSAERAGLANWAKCLGADAGADYLIAIIDHMDGRTQRPLPPWQRTARANSISPFEGR